METQTLPFTIYAESTPNPTTMKFVSNHLFIEDGSVIEYTEPEQTTDSPLAAKLFNFPFVTGLFITGNFISVTKNDIVEWDDIALEVREYIQDYLRSGQPVFNAKPESLPADGQGKPTAKGGTATNASAEEMAVPTTDLEKRIAQVLEEYVRPAVEQDGGAIHFKSFNEENGQLTVILKGACSGCPSSSMTLKNGIQGLYNRMVPEVKDVVAEEL